jgi:hypothetical protein
MEKKIALLTVAFMIVIVTNSAVLALTSMGPPKAMLGQDRWDIGVEYSYQSMDLEATGTDIDIYTNSVYPETNGITTRKGKYEINDFKSNVILGRLGYGISDSWDAFVRLGAVDAKCDLVQTYSDGARHEYQGFDGSFGLAWGFGTRATFWQDGEISWGGLFQMTWLEPDDSSISGTLEDNLHYTGTADIDIREIQIAIGPTWRIEDSVRIYGGPFLHYVDGDLDVSGSTTISPTERFDMKSSGDLEEKSQFGGYVGANLDVDENTSCFIEYQLTDDAWAIGLGAARRF